MTLAEQAFRWWYEQSGICRVDHGPISCLIPLSPNIEDGVNETVFCAGMQGARLTPTDTIRKIGLQRGVLQLFECVPHTDFPRRN